MTMRLVGLSYYGSRYIGNQNSGCHGVTAIQANN